MMKSTGSIASASRFTLAFALLFQMASASAQFSLIFNINDLKSREIEAAYTTGQDTKEIVWTTSAKPMPEVQKNNDACSPSRIWPRGDLLSCLRRQSSQ
ncbi:hypothetical protein [Massilia alkalitolerans]|uniref:hypothetical protein n=1 Tax=Massilia alkalitolerans TaxID=286638 RepID=UPI0012EC5EA3|nr:hypothetical protein [Massilia alkalitolerans]